MMRNTYHPSQITSTIQQQGSASIPQSATKKARAELASTEADISMAKLNHSIGTGGDLNDLSLAEMMRINDERILYYSGKGSVFAILIGYLFNYFICFVFV